MSDLLNNQIEYYRARAAEYDEWHERRGRYDRGTGHRRKWLAELAQVRVALRSCAPLGACLELACGTGLWTPDLADLAGSVTALDAVSEVIQINRSRTADMTVTYEVADIFAWTPPTKFDFIFFGFWLSHVPEERFDEFWGLVDRALGRNGRVFFVDSLQTQDSTARNHATLTCSGVVERKLNDGREFSIVKVFHKPEELGGRLSALGWRGTVRATGQFFYYTCLSR